MRSRALFLVAAAALAAVMIGCGGNSGGGNNGGGNNGTTSGVPGATEPGDSVEMVNLPAPTRAVGRVNVAYLPLQGRLLSSETVVIPNLELALGSDTFIDPLSSDIQFILNGNQVQQRASSVPIPDNLSRPFDTYFLNITNLSDSDNDSFGDVNHPFLEEQGFPAQVRVFPSRETTIPIYLNDSMFQIAINPDTQLLEATFLPDVFTARNGSPVKGFISDFLDFDISQVNNRPVMFNGEFADRVYFSGDKFGLSESGNSGYFEMLTDDAANPRQGEFTAPVTTGSSNTPGIYRTLVPDPTDPTNTNQITELYGIFRHFADPLSPGKSMVINTGDFEVLLMPKSGDDDEQQIIMVALNGTTATNLYWGDAHLASGTFVAYPIANLTTGSTTGAIQGTLTGYLDKNANPITINLVSDSRLVRYGHYHITTLKPATFHSTGRFIVFRV